MHAYAKAYALWHDNDNDNDWSDLKKKMQLPINMS